MKQQRRAEVGLRVAFTLGVAVVVALSAVGAVRGANATNSPTFTTKVMVAALKAIHYPAAHPKKLTCRGLGVAVKGRHTSFRCVAILKAHRVRRFYVRTVAKGGWLCAGKSPSRCVLQSRGFFPATAADNQGWQGVAVTGWLAAHHIDPHKALGVSCTGTRSPMTCTLRKNPPVTVVLTYQKAGVGYVETARRG